MTRPPLINLKQSSIVLSNNKHFLMLLLPHNANQPVIQERQVRFTNNTDYKGIVLGHKGSSFRQGIVTPLGFKKIGF